MTRKSKDSLVYVLIGGSAVFTIGILVWIIGFIFVNGLPLINLDFLTRDYEDKPHYVAVETIEQGKENQLGLVLDTKTMDNEEVVYVKSIESSSRAGSATNKIGEVVKLKKDDIIQKVSGKSIDGLTIAEVNTMINDVDKDAVSLKIYKPGGGVFPMIVTTVYIILLSLLIACPVGILAAIYLTEYAKPGRFVRLIRFATESLAGIPSIIYGLFGMLFFVITLNLNYSILSGALTLSIILLPVIIRQTEESIKAVPVSYREASFGLGATKLQTIRRAVLPSAIPGIIVAVILSIGRIVGESAALLFTAGTTVRVVDSLFKGGSTLTVKAFLVAQEEGDIAMACAIGTVIIILILILNAASKIISVKFNKEKA